MARQATANQQWARLGAATRLQQLRAEVAAIFKAYPELRRGVPKAGVPEARPKRQMSAAARKAMSDGMRKYWAKRKQAGK